MTVAEGDGVTIQARGEADDFALGVVGAGEFGAQGGFVAYSHFGASFDRADGKRSGEGEAALVGAGGSPGADSRRVSERVHRLGGAAVIAEGGKERVIGDNDGASIADHERGGHKTGRKVGARGSGGGCARFPQIWSGWGGVPRENSVAQAQARAAVKAGAEDAAAVESSGIVGEGALAQAEARAATTTADAVDAATIRVSRIAGEGALTQAQARAATRSAVTEDAATTRVSRIAAATRVSSRIVGEGALAQAQARAATISAVAEDSAAPKVSRISGEGASVEGELDGVAAAASIGINGTSGVVWEEIAGCVSAGEGEALEGDGAVGLDFEDTVVGHCAIGIDGEAVGEGRGVDDEVFIDEELLSVGEGDGFPVEGGLEGDEAAGG